MKTNFRILTVLFLLIGTSLLSCKKENNEENEMATSEDMALSESTFDQIFKEVDGNASENGLRKSYPIVTIDSTSSPRTMTIDYGSSNFLCNDGNYRRGKIMVSWTGRYKDLNTVIATTFDNFYQNDNKIEGAKTVTNTGRNASGQLTFSIAVDAKITNTANEVITWKSNRTRTWTNGELTKTWLDDKYLISGEANGVNRNGFTFTTKIISPLSIDLGCQWRIVAGTIELTPEGKPTRTIDYGNGSCDRTATVSVRGRTYTIQLRK
jgi:hypothetical protein